MNAVIAAFNIMRPKHQSPQKETLDWIVKAHTKAESLLKGFTPEETERFETDLKKWVRHVACSPSFIHQRGHEISDFLHTDWDDMEIYTLKCAPHGSGLSTRQALFRKIADQALETFYADEQIAPDHIFHVSCTGYASPSGPQTLIAAKNWQNTTEATHCYHMGCYGGISASRLAAGMIAQKSKRVDIVHTELCTLHFNPLNHAPDQLVGQSLFADGHIKYSIFPKECANALNLPHFEIVTSNEYIIPNSASAMEWILTDTHFHFTLSKEIPDLIAGSLRLYLKNLCQKAHLNFETVLDKAIFAIHPGGPKIIESIKNLLGLCDEQVAATKAVLQKYGNMSSATLPHIWASLDEDLPEGTLIVSLAFGPGLTIAGSILRYFSRH